MIPQSSASRDAILSRLHGLLAHEPPGDVPPSPEVWPRENPSVDAMGKRFCDELQAVSGETISCRSMDEARSRLRELLDKEGWGPLGAMDRPACREITSGLDAGRVAWAQSDWTPPTMAELPAGLVEADCLLADTGTSMIACDTAQDRLLCYLPPVCIVVALASRLKEHLPAAWPEIAPRVAEPDRRGEFVFVTGPSRTADIEKILILGVHGPKRLVVLLVGNDKG
jgi:L-lactate dehydrogenase complex protein LldG